MEKTSHNGKMAEIEKWDNDQNGKWPKWELAKMEKWNEEWPKWPTLENSLNGENATMEHYPMPNGKLPNGKMA